MKNDIKKVKQFGIQEHTVIRNLSYIILITITQVYLLKGEKIGIL